MSSADRVRAYRRRRDAGRVVLPVEVNEVDTVEALIEAGRLLPHEAEDRGAVAVAISKLIEELNQPVPVTRNAALFRHKVKSP